MYTLEGMQVVEMALVWGQETASLHDAGKELLRCLSLNHKPGGWISSLHKELLTATPGIKPVNNPSLLHSWCMGVFSCKKSISRTHGVPP